MTEDKSPKFRRLSAWAWEHGPKIYFGVALLLLVFGYGVVVGKYQVFPHAILADAKVAAIELGMWLELYKPVEKPEDHPHVILWPGLAPNEKTLYPDTDELTFIAGYRPGGFELFLVDPNGEEHHAWRTPKVVMQKVIATDKWAAKPDHYEIMGAHLAPNGDVVFNISYKATVKIDRCSGQVWYLGKRNHHSVFMEPDGMLWIPGRRTFREPHPGLPHVRPPFADDLILKVSQDGRILESISVLEAAFQGGFLGLVLHGFDGQPESVNPDPTHVNDVELISEAFAANHDFADKGDILVSMRSLDAIAIIDRQTHEMKFLLSGMMLRQHDPDQRENGNILLFDNRTSQAQHNEARYLTERQDFGYSRIIEIDPRTQRIVWSFEGTEQEPFYSSIQGDLQELENGNILVAESEGGRVFEIDRKTHKIVWEYRNVIGKTDDGLLLGRVTNAFRVHKNELDFLGKPCP